MFAARHVRRELGGKITADDADTGWPEENTAERLAEAQGLIADRSERAVQAADQDGADGAASQVRCKDGGVVPGW